MRILLTLNILILLGFGGATYWLRQKTHALIDTKKQVIVRDAMLKQAKARLTSAREDVRNAEEKYENVRKRLPTEQQVPDFFSYVSTLAAKDQVTAVFGNTLQTTASPSSTGEVPLLLTLNSAQSVDNVRRFVADLEQSDYIIAVTDVTITSGSVATVSPGQPAAPSVKSNATGNLGFILYVKKATN